MKLLAGPAMQNFPFKGEHTEYYTSLAVAGAAPPLLLRRVANTALWQVGSSSLRLLVGPFKLEMLTRQFAFWRPLCFALSLTWPFFPRLQCAVVLRSIVCPSLPAT